MTTATRNGLIGLLDSPAVAEIDQAVMSAYLAPYSSHADYVERATGETVYFAVQATAEYHEHWERVGSASAMKRHLYSGCRQAEDENHCHCKPTCCYCGASTVTETPFDSRFERVVNRD